MGLLSWVILSLLGTARAETTVTLCLNYPTTITFTSYTTVYETVENTVVTTVSSSSVSKSTALSISTSAEPEISSSTSQSTTTVSSSSADSTTSLTSTDIPSTSVVTTTSSTTSAAEPDGTNVLITVEIPDNILLPRSLRYIAFNETLGIYVDDMTQAAIVKLYPNGTITYSGLFVVGIEINNQTVLGLSQIMPSSFAQWNTDDGGNVLISGSNGFCTDGSPNVLVKTNSTDTSCQTVELSILDESSTASTTSSVPMSTSAATSSSANSTTIDSSTSNTKDSSPSSSIAGSSSESSFMTDVLSTSSSESSTMNTVSTDSSSSETSTTTSENTSTTVSEETSTSSLTDTNTTTMDYLNTTIMSETVNTTTSGYMNTTSTISTTSESTTSSSTTTSSCAATDTAMLAITDEHIDRKSYTNLFLSDRAVLNYADPPPGKNAVSVTVQANRQLVLFENSIYLDPITCHGNSIQVQVTDSFAYTLAIYWPQSGFVIVTNTPGCNTQTERGVYIVDSFTSNNSTKTIAFAVTKVEWAEVAETMALSYGTVAATNGTDPVYSSSCTNTLASPPTTTSSAGISETSLSPAVKAMLDYVLQQVVYDPDKNEMLIVSKPDPVNLKGGEKVVTEPDELDKIINMLKQDGISDPDALFDDAKPPTGGSADDSSDPSGICKITPGVPRICEILPTCPTTPPTSSSPAGGKRKRNATMGLDSSALMLRGFDPILEQRHLEERSLSTVLEYVCSDWAELLCAPFEKIDQIRELVCALKDAYEAAQQLYDLIKCLAKGPFCFNPPSVTITINYPPAQKWTYTYGWKASWNGLNGYYIVMGSPGNFIQCTDCSFSISDLTVQGSLTYNVSAQTITEAKNTVRMSSVARLIMILETTGPWTGKGTAFQSTLSLGNQQIDSMFSFAPTVVFSLGAEANANAPVSSNGGAVLTFNGATVDLNYLSKTAVNANNWQPAIVMTYPGFKNDAKVNFAPIMITDVRIQMNVLKGVLNSYSAITSQLSVGFNATYSDVAVGTCGAKQLSVRSYVKSQSNAVFNGGAPILLGGNTNNNPIKCYNVPTYFPSGEEVSSLALVGGDFCTSYIGYKPPVKVISTGTVTSLLSSTTETTTLTSTTTDIATSTITATFSSSLAATLTVSANSTVYVGGGKDSIGTSKKRSEALPVPRLFARDPASTPSMVKTWSSDKISYACSMIATGTKIATVFTSTTTTFTSTSTSTVTATRYVAVAGPPSSVTTTSTRFIVTALASTTVSVASTTTVFTQCPLQTQVACFKVKAHGVDLVEGMYLGTGLASNRGPAVLGANTESRDSIFYLDDSGKLISVLTRKPLSYLQTALKPPVQCDPNDHYPNGKGGCQNCYCDLRGDGGAICVDDKNIRNQCPGKTDFECPADTFCDITIGPVCESWYGCTSTYKGPFVEFPDQLWAGEALIITPGTGTSGVTATCKIDCDTLRLTCTGPDGLTQLYVFDPRGEIANRNYVQGFPGWPNGFSDLPFRMMWKTGPAGYSILPIYLTVEEATCPCSK